MDETREKPAGRRARSRRMLIWLARISLAVFFLAASISKLLGAERQIILFDRIGWGHWFRYFTGVAEFIPAILLLVPATGFVGALGTFIVSIGALVTLMSLGKPLYPALFKLMWSGILVTVLRDQRREFYAIPRYDK